MKNIIKSLKFLITFLLFVCLFIACDKDYNVLESDVLGSENSNYKTNNSLWPVIGFNKKLDSLQINGLGNTAANSTTLAANLLGVYNDPNYGLTTASIVSQLTPKYYGLSFGTNPVVDSVILTIPYYSTPTGSYDANNNPEYEIDSLYGTSKPINLNIFRSNYYLRDFDPNNTENRIQNYYSKGESSQNIALNGSSVINFDDHTTDLIYSDSTFIPSNKGIITTVGTGSQKVTTKLSPSLRVELDNEYWQETILNQEGNPALSTPAGFKNYFRGLYFKSETITSDGSMVLFNLASINSHITIYYTSGTEGSREQKNYVLNFSGHILNTFINNFSIPQSGNKTTGDEALYLQGTQGSMAVIDLFNGKVDCDGDGLEDMDAIDCFKHTFRQTDEFGNYLKDPITERFLLKKLINEAQIILTVANKSLSGGTATFDKNNRLYAYNLKDNSVLLDYSIDPTKNSSDPYNSNVVSLGQNEDGVYKIRITQFLTNILFTDSIPEDTPTKIGITLSNNVNYTSNSEILNSEDDVSAVPKASILMPRGTILQGSTTTIPEDSRIKLKIFYSEPK